jgi:DNA polymerase-1
VRGIELASETWPGVPLRRAYTRLAMISLIQGSAADWIKKAMLALWRAGIAPMLQVHDEIDSSTKNHEQGKRIAEIVRDVVQLKCPVVVDSGDGANWRDAKA